MSSIRHLLNSKLHRLKWRPERTFTDSTAIRKQFIDYFTTNHNHEFVKSSPVSLPTDPSLLFVNAGMNQFKPIFLDYVNPKYRRVVNSQKCVRVGGKHNDLDQVGNDGYHHTFFEMLGNWSFGDYFKEEACKMSWEFLTDYLRLPKHKLYVTYFAGDEKLGLEADLECREIWLRLGVKSDRILPFGCKENFWLMGDCGPCGPCTEIHYDHGLGDASDLVNSDNPRVVEVWNLVFIQFDRTNDGVLRRLPRAHVDTGMGLERLTAILKNSRSNYDTDLFIPLFDVIQKNFSIQRYGGNFGVEDVDGIDRAYRIVADHSRMLAISLSDGVLPDEIGAGHLVRRLIRRSLLVAKSSFGSHRFMLSQVVSRVADILGDAYPELVTNRIRCVQVVNEEEEKFLEKLELGQKLFDEMAKKSKSTFSGEDLFKLNFVYGLPEEFLADLTSTLSLIPDWMTFNKLKLAEREKSRVASKLQSHKLTLDPLAIETLKKRGVKPTDDQYKYENIEKCFSARIVGLLVDSEFVDELKIGQSGSIILNRTNFYSCAGGQQCDDGVISSQIGNFDVIDVQTCNGFVEHHGKLTEGRLSVDGLVNLQVNKCRRDANTRSHTATHLVAESVSRMTSNANPRSFYCESDKLRMEFTAKKSFTVNEILQIENLANGVISGNISVNRQLIRHSNYSQYPTLKLQSGEIYPDPTRVIAISSPTFSSTEACCGTHVNNTSEIGRIVVVSHKSRAQTVKNISAVTGEEAIRVVEYGNKLKGRVEQIRRNLDHSTQLANHENHDSLLKEIKSVRRDLVNNLTSYVVRINLEADLEKLERDNKSAKKRKQLSMAT